MRNTLVSLVVLLAANAAFAADLGLVTDPIPFGTPTLQVYVDGELGGQLDWSNTGVDEPMPEGACGVRIDGTNLLAWSWYEGGIYGTEVMDIENNGLELPNEPGEWIQFSGPYGDNCDDGYVVLTPASIDGVPPWGSVKLALQFLDWDDITFLDSSLMPLPPIPPGNPDPEPPNPCAIPEFCEPNYDLVNCLTDFEGENHCDDEAIAGDLSLTSFGASTGLRALANSFANTTTKVAVSATKAANAARKRIDRARKQHDLLVRSSAARSLPADEALLLGRLASAIDFAHKRVAECRIATKRARRSRQPGADGTPKRAQLACRSAADQTLDAHEAAGMLSRSLAGPSR